MEFTYVVIDSQGRSWEYVGDNMEISPSGDLMIYRDTQGPLPETKILQTFAKGCWQSAGVLEDGQG